MVILILLSRLTREDELLPTSIPRDRSNACPAAGLLILPVLAFRILLRHVVLQDEIAFPQAPAHH